MKVFEETNQATGLKSYKVEIGGKLLSFSSNEDREKFLYFLYLALIKKNKQLIDALVWLWEHRQAEILRVLKKYFSVFAAFFLPLAALQVSSNNFYLVQNLLNQLVDFVLVILPTQQLTHPVTEEYLQDFDFEPSVGGLDLLKKGDAPHHPKG